MKRPSTVATTRDNAGLFLRPEPSVRLHDNRASLCPLPPQTRAWRIPRPRISSTAPVGSLIPLIMTSSLTVD